MIEIPFVAVVNNQLIFDKLYVDASFNPSDIGMGVWGKYNTYTAYVALYEGNPYSQVDVFYRENNPNWNIELEEALRNHLG